MSNKEVFERNFIKYRKWYTIMTFVIALLEVIMMIRGLFVFDFTNTRHIVYFIAYIFLFIVSFCAGLLLLCIKGNEKIKIFQLAVEIYSICILIWSMVISYLDMSVNNSMIVYLTIIMGIGCFSYFKPYKFVIISISSIGFMLIAFYLSNISLSAGPIINMCVFEGTAIFISSRLYNSVKDEFTILKKVECLSMTDQLTGLQNRRSLDEKIFDLHIDGVPYVFCLIDVDNFKHINDEYGHKTGDDVLKGISKLILENFNKNSYRYGGDEIAIISFESKDIVYAKMVTIQEKLGKIIPNVIVTISFGMYDNNHNEGPRDVFIYADKSLYEAKNSGKNCGRIYNEKK